MFEMTVRVCERDVLIQTHDEPHIDEAAAIMLVEECADKDFLDRHAPDHTLQLAIPGCFFDEHPNGDQPRKEDECCATLVAQELGLPDSPSIGRMLKYVFRDDDKGSGDHSTIGGTMKRMYRMCPNEAERVMRWSIQGLRAKVRQRCCSRDFRIDAIREAICELDGQETATSWYAEVIRSENVNRQWFKLAEREVEDVLFKEVCLPSGVMVTIATIETDNPKSHIVALNKGATIVVKKETRGNVQIFSNKDRGLQMCGVARILSIAEQFARRDLDRAGNPRVLDETVLCSEGNPTGFWYYFPKMEAVFNGSLTERSIPATALPLSFICLAVQEGLKPVHLQAKVHAIRRTLIEERKA